MIDVRQRLAQVWLEHYAIERDVAGASPSVAAAVADMYTRRVVEELVASGVIEAQAWVFTT